MTELRNCYNDETLLRLAEELQTETEQQKSLIQKLTSEKQELLSLTAEQQNRIAEQQDRIEKLNASDRELQKSQQLLSESKERLKISNRKQNEAEILKGKAEAQLLQARSETQQAELAMAHLQEIIDENVKDKAKRLELEAEKEVKAKSKTHFAQLGSLTGAVSLYCIVITVVWLTDHWEILKTVPQWFVNRGHNLQTLWGGVVKLFSWAYKLLQPHMPDFIAKAIPFVLMLAVVMMIAYFAIWKGGKKLKEQWLYLWNQYDYKDKKLFKESVTVAIVMMSIPLAVLVVGFLDVINVMSWWLLFSILLNVIYHIATYKRW